MVKMSRSILISWLFFEVVYGLLGLTNIVLLVVSLNTFRKMAKHCESQIPNLLYLQIFVTVLMLMIIAL